MPRMFNNNRSSAEAKARPVVQRPESYDPNNLINALVACTQSKNDAALAAVLETSPPVVSKMRHGAMPVTSAMLIRMHETTGLEIRQMRELMGDRRTKYRLATKVNGASLNRKGA